MQFTKSAKKISISIEKVQFGWEKYLWKRKENNEKNWSFVEMRTPVAVQEIESGRSAFQNITDIRMEIQQ